MMNFRSGLGFKELDEFANEMNRLIAESARPFVRRAAEFPPVNVWEKDDSLLLTADVPGLTSEDLELSIEGDVLTISGQFAASNDDESNFHRRERIHGEFSRSISLPFAVDPESAKARLENGVLELRLERPDSDKPHKIAIT